jgi:hypothetical protein
VAEPLSWPERVLDTLTPSGRTGAILTILAGLAMVILFGLMIVSSVQTDRRAREHERAVQEAIARMPTRPTLHERLDAIERRLEAIEQQLKR